MSTCIGCGRDVRESGHAWKRIALELELGVCSACPDYLTAWDDAHAFGPAHFDLVAHLRRQREFSLRTFGPGPRSQGVIDHIQKELAEIAAAPDNVEEWIDVVLLALDGAWRAGHDPAAIALALSAKQTRNTLRTWPDWRTAEPGKAIEHTKSHA